MNILMIHNRYLIRGGEDESTDMEVALLRQYGHEVELVEFDNRSIARQGLLRTGIETIWSSRAYRLVLNKLHRQPFDVVHVQNFFPLLSPSVLHAAKSVGKPVIQSLRNYRLLCINGLFFRDGHPCEDCMGLPLPWPGLIHKCYRNNLPGSLVTTSMLIVHRMLGTWHRKVDLFLTLSDFARDKLVQGGLPADRIAVKPNFVHPDPGAGNGKRDFFLLVGRLSEEKGVLTVLKAWEELGNSIPLKIVGDGPLAHFVNGKAKKMTGIEVLGRRDLPDVYDLMGRARAVLFPTLWYETFGRVVIEAYAKGTPVIASNLGAGGQLVQDMQTGLLFTPGDAAGLAQQVRRMWEHEAEAHAMGRAGRTLYETQYTAEKNHALLMEVYVRTIRTNREDKERSHAG